MGSNRRVSPARRCHSIGTLVAALGLAIATAACGQTNSLSAPASDSTGCAVNLKPWLQYIASELRKLHLELLEDRREIQQARLTDIAGELRRVQAQQHELQEEQQSRTQQVSEIESQLAQGSLAKEEREELEARQADLLAGPPAILGSVQAVLAQREAQARERLALQERRVQLLEQQARELAPVTK